MTKKYYCDRSCSLIFSVFLNFKCQSRRGCIWRYFYRFPLAIIRVLLGVSAPFRALTRNKTIRICEEKWILYVDKDEDFALVSPSRRDRLEIICYMPLWSNFFSTFSCFLIFLYYLHGLLLKK